MKLNKTLMCSALALGLLAGVSEGHATLNAYEQHLKSTILEKGIALDDLDVKVFAVMLPKFVKPLVDKWKEAKAAGMGNSDIRAIIGTNKNQAAIDALTQGIANRKGGGGNSSNSSNSTALSDADADQAILKVFGKALTLKDKALFYAYLLKTAKTKGKLDDLLADMKFYQDKDTFALTPEQYMHLKNENFDFKAWATLKGYGADFDAVLKMYKQGNNINVILAKFKPKANPAGSEQDNDKLLTDMIKDLGINVPGFTDRLDTFNAEAFLKALTEMRENNQGESLTASPSERKAFLDQLRSDLQSYIKDGATGSDLLVLFEKTIPYESWVAYKTNTAKSLKDFVKAIQGGKVFLLRVPGKPETFDFKKTDVPPAFAILGLDTSATDNNIKVSHRKLIMVLHPDKHPKEAFRLYNLYLTVINAANDILKDPALR